jgi:hypothetical protein
LSTASIPQSVPRNDLVSSIRHRSENRPPIAGEFADISKLNLEPVMQKVPVTSSGDVSNDNGRREGLIGDIISFGGATTVGSGGHVGIYLGHDMYISATSLHPFKQNDVVIKEIDKSQTLTFRSVDNN